MKTKSVSWLMLLAGPHDILQCLIAVIGLVAFAVSKNAITFEKHQLCAVAIGTLLKI